MINEKKQSPSASFHNQCEWSETFSGSISLSPVLYTSWVSTERAFFTLYGMTHAQCAETMQREWNDKKVFGSSQI